MFVAIRAVQAHDAQSLRSPFSQAISSGKACGHLPESLPRETEGWMQTFSPWGPTMGPQALQPSAWHKEFGLL